MDQDDFIIILKVGADKDTTREQMEEWLLRKWPVQESEIVYIGKVIG